MVQIMVTMHHDDVVSMMMAMLNHMMSLSEVTHLSASRPPAFKNRSAVPAKFITQFQFPANYCMYSFV